MSTASYDELQRASSSWETPEPPPRSAEKRCTGCQQELDPSIRRARSEKNKKGETLYLPMCKICKPLDDKLRRDLKKNEDMKKKPLRCECCGVLDPNLQFDHCKRTKRKRGWLCRRCNCGFGMLGDSAEGLIEGLMYYQKTDPERKDVLSDVQIQNLQDYIQNEIARSKARSRSPH